jgi:hypothetical protein
MQTTTPEKGKLVSKLDDRVNLSLLGLKYNQRESKKATPKGRGFDSPPVGCQKQWSIGVKEIVGHV